MTDETDYPSAEEYYPKAFHCRCCGRFTHGIIAGRYNPHGICNNCAVPTENLGEYFRDADGSVSLA